MPELPEVARTVISLNNRLQNKEISEVIIHSGRYIRHGDPIGLDRFRLDLPAKVESVKFYGKFNKLLKLCDCFLCCFWSCFKRLGRVCDSKILFSSRSFKKNA